MTWFSFQGPKSLSSRTHLSSGISVESEACMGYTSFILLLCERGLRHFSSVWQFLPDNVDVLGIHLKTKQKIHRVRKRQTLPKYQLAFYGLKLKSGHFYCWHLTGKNPISWKVRIWRNETSWQMHHNLAILLSYFRQRVPKWPSTVTHRETETRRNWIVFPSFYLSLPRKKRKRRWVSKKNQFSSFGSC